MKQLLQNLSDGRAQVADVPAPKPQPGEVLVRVRASLISAGTERNAVEFSEKNLVQKALARPDLVRQVLNKASREGVFSALNAVRSRLDADLALGYSNAGTVLEVGAGVTGFAPGDRVACAGLGYASHAEVVRVPRNLLARIPAAKTERAEVEFEEAAFATLGAIAMQGCRLAQLQLGEAVVVLGLGLVGLLAVQLAKAAGCLVLGLDPVAERCALAERLGCDATARDPEQLTTVVAAHTTAIGADAIIITAATASSGPLEVAGEVARDHGRVVAVGDVGMQIPRKPYYEKELSFVISRSYGPGRYDPEYEEKGHDYPPGFVRWTENRNLQAFLRLLADGKINVKPLITHRFAIEDATRGYDLISGKTGEPFLGVLIDYGADAPVSHRVELRPRASEARDCVRLGMIGAGSFTTSTLLPAVKSLARIELAGLCAMTGASARGAATRSGFRYCTSDENELLSDPSINTIAIATRHHLHARQVIAALQAGKNVFCEKPLCVSEEELAEIVRAHENAPGAPCLMVGFNRRFAPLARDLRQFAATAGEPAVMHYRVNAGFVPPTHWIQDPEQGAGRIIGEVCHFIDLLAFVVGQPVASTFAIGTPGDGRYRDDNLAIMLSFADGSLGTITYTAAGDKSFPKERLEIFSGGGTGVLDDFRSLQTVRHGKGKTLRSRLRQDKGHRGEWQALAAAILHGQAAPIPFREIVNTTLATFRVVQSLRTGQPTSVDAEAFLAQALPPDARNR